MGSESAGIEGAVTRLLEGAEIAEVLGLSERTVRRDWAKARAWLYQALYPDASV